MFENTQRLKFYNNKNKNFTFSFSSNQFAFSTSKFLRNLKFTSTFEPMFAFCLFIVFDFFDHISGQTNCHLCLLKEYLCKIKKVEKN